MPTCTNCPPHKTAIRSPSISASTISCVTKTAVSPTSRRIWRNACWRRSRVSGSRAPNGSSSSITDGPAARARATPTRCCCPPESS